MKEKPSLLIIGNSNTGKSSITRLLLPNPRKFKGKSGKTPGSTLLIKPISQPSMKFQIVDLPGFGYMSQASHRREEHIKKQIVVHIEKHHSEYSLCLVIINVQRIEDEINKYLIQNKQTIPLSFELINFLNEFDIPLLVIINKIDKISKYDKKRVFTLFLKSAKEIGLDFIHLDDINIKNSKQIMYLEFSALRKINLDKLKKHIQRYFA